MLSIPIDSSKKTAVMMPHAESRDKDPEGITHKGLIHTLGIAGALIEGKAHKFQKTYCNSFLGSIHTAQVITHAAGGASSVVIINKGLNISVKDTFGAIAQVSPDKNFICFVSPVRVMEQVGEIYRIKTKDETAMKMNNSLFFLSCDKWGDFEDFQNMGNISALVCEKHFHELSGGDKGNREQLQKLMKEFEYYFYKPDDSQKIPSLVLRIPPPDLHEFAKSLGNILQFSVKTK
jgi:hypothetical protein